VKGLSIKVNIANRVYPLTVKPEEEESIRKAVKAINEMIKEFEHNYAVKDTQDLLAMCALQFGSQSFDLEDKTKGLDTETEERLKRLATMVGENL
jgi:cell division protein ZapA